MRTARCRRCGKPIIWCLATRRDGSMAKQPFDQDSHPAGTHEIVGTSDPVARYVEAGDRRPIAGMPSTLHREHFRTCTTNRTTT